MMTFAIENDTNNITLHMTSQEAAAEARAEIFHDEAGLVTLAACWPTARLVDIWNSLPGATPVKKFTDRKTAVTRIWNAIQRLAEHVPPAVDSEEPQQVPAETEAPEDTEELELAPGTGAEPESPGMAAPDPTVAPQSPDVASEGAHAGTKPTRAKKEPKTATIGSVPREGSKTSMVIAMLKREGGATLEEIMAAMGWQKHTTRAMLSAGGSLTKNHGLVIVSEKVGDKRTYSIKA
jgi:hypothetical protein